MSDVILGKVKFIMEEDLFVDENVKKSYCGFLCHKQCVEETDMGFIKDIEVIT